MTTTSTPVGTAFPVPLLTELLLLAAEDVDRRAETAQVAVLPLRWNKADQCSVMVVAVVVVAVDSRVRGGVMLLANVVAE